MMIHILGILIVLVGTTAAPDVTAQIVIGDENIPPEQIAVTLPLTGLRVFPTELLARHNNGNDGDIWSIDANVFYSVAQFQSLKDTQNRTNYFSRAKNLSNQDITSSINVLNQVSANSEESITIYERNSDSTWRTHYSVDAYLVSELAGKIKTASAAPTVVETKTSTGEEVKRVVIDTAFAKQMAAIYSIPTESNTYADILKSGKAIQLAASSPDLGGSVSVDVDWVTIGKPLAFTAAEKKLKVEKSLTDRFDIYFIQFAMNPRRNPRISKIVELKLVINLNNSSAMALEIIPIRTGTEQNVTTTAKTPGITVELPSGAGVSVGEIYGQQIEFKSLKPTILGNGLQESIFGWEITNEALDTSAKRFVAVIGVPKKTRRLEMEAIVSARVKAGWLKDDLAATKPHTLRVDLPN